LQLVLGESSEVMPDSEAHIMVIMMYVHLGFKLGRAYVFEVLLSMQLQRS
jgi:hypothetical protein